MGSSQTDEKIVVKGLPGEEYQISGTNTWVKANDDGEVIFDGLTSNKNYTIKARLAETDEAMAGPVSDPTTQRTKIASKDVPGPTVAPTLDVKNTSIEVTNVDKALEYSIDGGTTWVKPNVTTGKVVFTGLEEDSDYTVMARTAETDTAMPSADTVSTDAKTLCTLAGTITDENGEAVPGAKIKVVDKDGNVVKELTADENGDYETILPSGDYKIVVEGDGKDGKESAVKDVTLTGSPDPTNPKKNNVTTTSGIIASGKVTDANGKPVANATIELFDKNTLESIGTVTTDAEGNYYMPGMKDGTYQATVYGMDEKGLPYSASSEMVAKDGNLTTSGDFTVSQGYLASGSAIGLDTDGDGTQNPLKDAIVTITDENGAFAGATTVLADGSYVVPGLPAGTYKATFTEPTTGAVIEREIKVVPSNTEPGKADIVPSPIDGSAEMTAEKFIQGNLKEDGKAITSATASNYDTIIAAEGAYNALSDAEKAAVNKALAEKYHGKTYPELLAKAKTIKENTNNFVKKYLTNKDGSIIKKATYDNYKKILSGESAWNKLSAEEKAAVNAKLAPTTYPQLLKQAKALKAEADKILLLKGTGKKKFFKTSNTIHVSTKGGELGNYKKINVNKKKVTLKVNKTAKLSAKATPYKKPGNDHIAKVRYISSNKKIATVTANGKIKAKKKGTCKIYVLTIDGKRKTVQVTVK